MDVDEGGPSTQAKTTQPPKKKPRKEEGEFPAEITIFSWNVDGLDPAEIHRRFEALLVLIEK